MAQLSTCKPFSCLSNNAARRRMKCVKVSAALEPASVFAITQQATAFAICSGAEAVFTRNQLKDGAPGRPEVVPLAAGLGGVLTATALVKAGSMSGIGMGLGLVSSLGMLAYNAKRILDTKHDPLEWPGPKAWPAVMALFSFFALNLFIQGFRDSI